MPEADLQFNTCMKQKACIPRNVAVGNLSKARRTLLTMACSQQPDWRMMTEMYSSSVTGLMQIFPGAKRADTETEHSKIANILVFQNCIQGHCVTDCLQLTFFVVEGTNVHTLWRMNDLQIHGN